MSCRSCGGRAGNPRRYKVTLQDGTERIFLTATESRIFATQNGGGTITTLTTDGD